MTTASQTMQPDEASQAIAAKPQVKQTTKPRSRSLSNIFSKTLIYLTLIILGITWIFPLDLDGHLGAQG